jgi:hypothetical protein
MLRDEALSVAEVGQWEQRRVTASVPAIENVGAALRLESHRGPACPICLRVVPPQQDSRS